MRNDEHPSFTKQRLCEANSRSKYTFVTYYAWIPPCFATCRGNGFMNSFALLEYGSRELYKPLVYRQDKSSLHLVQFSSNELPCQADFSSHYSPSRPPPLPLRATPPPLSSAETLISAVAVSSRTKSPPSVCSPREHHVVPAAITQPAARPVRQGTRAQMVRIGLHAGQAHTLLPARHNVRCVHTELSQAVSTPYVIILRSID